MLAGMAGQFCQMERVKGGIYMRLGRTQTGMNLYRYKIFAAIYMKPERYDIFFVTNVSLTQKHMGLKFLDPV